jgi:bifunctional non-homologous end joining protein LigD
MVYFAFDLLYLDGFDLRNAPLVERKRILAALLEEAKSDCFHLAQHLEVAPALVFDQACATCLEGIVCKLRDAPYRSGDRASWLKIKCVKRGVFPIVGFIPAPDSIAALHLARLEGKALAYAGRAGTGFTQKSARELREVLDELVTDRPPVGGAPLRPKSTWVRPELSAMVDYTAITREGLLRHASFKGLQQSRGKRARTIATAFLTVTHTRERYNSTASPMRCSIWSTTPGTTGLSERARAATRSKSSIASTSTARASGSTLGNGC